MVDQHQTSDQSDQPSSTISEHPQPCAYYVSFTHIKHHHKHTDDAGIIKARILSYPFQSLRVYILHSSCIVHIDTLTVARLLRNQFVHVCGMKSHLPLRKIGVVRSWRQLKKLPTNKRVIGLYKHVRRFPNAIDKRYLCAHEKDLNYIGVFRRLGWYSCFRPWSICQYWYTCCWFRYCIHFRTLHSLKPNTGTLDINMKHFVAFRLMSVCIGMHFMHQNWFSAFANV